MFRCKKYIFSVKSIIFIKKNTKKTVAFKLYSKFWRITLTNVKNVTKNLILTILWASSFVKK